MVMRVQTGLSAEAAGLQFNERVVFTRRVAKVVKGGRHLRFNALVVIGDGQGVVGAGLGKSEAIPDAVRKANAIARKNLVRMPLKGNTIPHEVRVRRNACLVIIKPAPPGTGVIASAPVRAVMELGGVKDVVAKTLGSRNPINIVYTTLEALRQLKDPIKEISERKGLLPASQSQRTSKEGS